MTYRYTVDAWNKDQWHNVDNVIQIVVNAHSPEEAVERAKVIEARTDYKVVRVEEQNPYFTKLMGTQTVPPVIIDDPAAKKIQKG